MSTPTLEKRLGFIGIVIENRASVPGVNAILSEYAQCIRGRMGIPDHARNINVISLIVECTNDQIGAMTGRLGTLSGITVKSAVTKSKT